MNSELGAQEPGWEIANPAGKSVMAARSARSAMLALLLLQLIAAVQTLRLGRRPLFGLAASAAAASPAQALPALDGYDPAAAVTRASAGRQYFPPLTPPLFKRATYRYEMGRDAWALEQLLTFANVSATVRTVVVRLKDGSLWVDGPQWPTGEFCALLDELGPVGHVVLPCVALEHKAPLQAFCKRYPKASVWIAPGQYGPFGSCGLEAASASMGYRVDGVFPVGAPKPGDKLPPWADEFDMRTLYVDLPENAGPVAETAFLHRPTSTLITTDAVVYVPSAPPPIFETYFDKAAVADPSFWPKSVIQAVFLPLREDTSASASAPERWPAYGAVQSRLLRAHVCMHACICGAGCSVRRSSELLLTPTSYILHPTSYIRHPTSYILHPTSDIRHPTSYILHPTSDIRHPTSDILHPTSYILHPTSYIRHPTSYLRHPTSDILLDYILHPTSGILLDYILHPTSYIRHPTSDILLEYILHPTSYLLPPAGAPILRAFADSRAPDEVRTWVSQITSWKFDRVLTAHFASPIRATPADFGAAFNYLNGPTADPPIACEDWALLDGLNTLIDTNKLGAPVKYNFKAGCTSAS